jgi:hypothetical protein
VDPADPPVLNHAPAASHATVPWMSSWVKSMVVMETKIVVMVMVEANIAVMVEIMIMIMMMMMMKAFEATAAEATAEAHPIPCTVGVGVRVVVSGTIVVGQRRIGRRILLLTVIL